MTDEKHNKVLASLENITLINGWAEFVSEKEMLIKQTENGQPNLSLQLALKQEFQRYQVLKKLVT